MKDKLVRLRVLLLPLPVYICGCGALNIYIFLKLCLDDRAIHFIQAEKLYYENALISTEEIQKKLRKCSLVTCFYGHMPYQPGYLSACLN